MALLVFMAFLAMLTNSYVPAWMTSNEREHMNTVVDQFGSLKGKVDTMIIEMGIKGTGATKMYAPIALGSAGVPIFAVPTSGILYYYPQGATDSGVEIEFNYTTNAGTVTHMPVSLGGGKVEMYNPNRYYVQQWVTYENGAVLIKQEDGQSMRAFPNLDVYYTLDDEDNMTIFVSYTQIDLDGSNESLSGSDSVGINLDLVYLDSQSFRIANDTCRLSFITEYGDAWYRYLDDLMNATGLARGVDYSLTTVDVSEGVVKINLVFESQLIVLDYNRALVSMSMLS